MSCRTDRVLRTYRNMYAYYADVSPDGKSVVFGASDTLGELGIGGAVSRWTPDGKGIAYYQSGRGGNLWIPPLDGSAPRQLTHFTDNHTINDFAWSRDGNVSRSLSRHRGQRYRPVQGSALMIGPRRAAACPWRIHKSCGDWSLIQPSTMSAPPVGFEIDG